MGIILIVITSFMWSFVPILTGILKDSMSPMALSFYRTFLAMLGVFAVFVLKREKLKIDMSYSYLILISCVLKVGYSIMFNWGVKLSDTFSAVIVLPTQTLFTLVLSLVFLKRKMGYDVFAGALLVVTGILAVSLNGRSIGTIFNSEYIYGNILFVLSGVFMSLDLTILKYISKRTRPIPALLIIYLLSSLLMYAIIDKHSFSFDLNIKNLSSLIVLGFLITGIGFYILTEAIKRISLVAGVIILNMSIALTVIIGILFFEQVLTHHIAIGLTLAMIGSIWINFIESKNMRTVQSYGTTFN